MYETPAWCTEELLKHVDIPTEVWEPACGNDAIGKVLRNHAIVTTGTDLYTLTGPMRVDFLQSHWRSKAIITNPPYSHAKKFIEHALTCTEDYRGLVAMLLRNEYDSAKTRRHLFADHPAFAMKLVLTKRPQWIEGEQKASPRHNFSWFIWDWQHTGPPVFAYGPANREIT